MGIRGIVRQLGICCFRGINPNRSGLCYYQFGRYYKGFYIFAYLGFGINKKKNIPCLKNIILFLLLGIPSSRLHSQGSRHIVRTRIGTKSTLQNQCTRSLPCIVACKKCLGQSFPRSFLRTYYKFFGSFPHMILRKNRAENQGICCRQSPCSILRP